MNIPSFQSTLGLVAVTWLTWRIAKALLAKDYFANIAGPPPESWITGSLLKIMDNNPWDYLKQITDEYGSFFKFKGFFGENILYLWDPKAMHNILVKEQYIYEPTADFIDSNGIMFGMGLFSTLGEHHRKQKKLLLPLFSIAHMRDMIPIFYEVVEKVQDTLKKQVVRGGGEHEVDMLSWMNRAALELIGRSGFGYSFDSLEENTVEHPFATSIKNLPRAITNNEILVYRLLLLPYVKNIGTPQFQRAVVDALPSKKLHELRDMMDTMHNTSTEIYEATKRSLEGRDSSDRIGGGKDIMSVMVKANEAASEEDRLPENEILAQISSLTFAAMDTTSNALCRIFTLLTEYPEAQERLRKEIQDARKEHGELDYDVLVSLPYLDAVCRESLRLYAPVAFALREARKDMILPLHKPVTTKDGKTLKEIFVPKDTRIILSLLHSNRDPEIWGPDALEWKPERWLNPLPDSIMEARIPGIYSHLMTFIGGGRACIGFKFSQLEMKIVLFLLLETFKFAPSGKKIVWQMNSTAQPTVEGGEYTASGVGKKLQLPMKLSLV